MIYIIAFICLIALVYATKIICDRTRKGQFRYIPLSTLLFGGLIFLILAIGRGGAEGIQYGVLSIIYLTASFGVYLYIALKKDTTAF
ncbi:hypothetical protein [Exiguobacterium flavidum]|uniref:hypothetical protein n=1 Tax=Exiguobacterium flavidum TaxID=2184695 RepID=UPI001E28B500|nr:hypothetical protein [Exiguobacterium flavidum]